MKVAYQIKVSFKHPTKFNERINRTYYVNTIGQLQAVKNCQDRFRVEGFSLIHIMDDDEVNHDVDIAKEEARLS